MQEYVFFGNPLETAYLSRVDYNVKKLKPLFEANQYRMDKSKIERLVYQYIVKEMNEQENERSE